MSTERIPHTPGPWKAIQGMDEDDVERWSIVADNGTRPYLIATIENGQPGDCCATEGATARLIAAAPDLLVAAIMAARADHHIASATNEELEAAYLDMTTTPEVNNGARAVLQLRHAIAKALGMETPTTES